VKKGGELRRELEDFCEFGGAYRVFWGGEKGIILKKRKSEAEGEENREEYPLERKR